MVSFQALPQWHAKWPIKLRGNENEKKWKVILTAFLFIHYHGTSWLSDVKSVKLYNQSSASWVHAWGSSSPTLSRWGWRAALINTLHTALEAIWPLSTRLSISNGTNTVNYHMAAERERARYGTFILHGYNLSYTCKNVNIKTVYPICTSISFFPI